MGFCLHLAIGGLLSAFSLLGGPLTLPCHHMQPISSDIGCNCCIKNHHRPKNVILFLQLLGRKCIVLVRNYATQGLPNFFLCLIASYKLYTITPVWVTDSSACLFFNDVQGIDLLHFSVIMAREIIDVFRLPIIYFKVDFLGSY